MSCISRFSKEILEGIPDLLPEPQDYDPNINHAPKRKDILTPDIDISSPLEPVMTLASIE